MLRRPPPSRLRAALDRPGHLADRRRDLPGRDRLAGVRHLELARRARTRGRRLDAADGAHAARRRGSERPLRPQAAHDRRGRPAGRGGRWPGCRSRSPGRQSCGTWSCSSSLYGVGDALFAPAFTAIVPDVVPQEDILQASALKELMEPVGLRFAGPALGGFLIAGLDVGAALVVDALTFAASAVAVSFMSPQPGVRQAGASAWEELRRASRSCARAPGCGPRSPARRSSCS